MKADLTAKPCPHGALGRRHCTLPKGHQGLCRADLSDATIDELADELAGYWGDYLTQGDLRHDLAVLLAEVQERARAEAAPRWVPTEEGLPAEGVPVLVWVRAPRRTGYCTIAQWADGEWVDEAGEWWAGAVLAWIELPPGPPKEGERE